RPCRGALGTTRRYSPPGTGNGGTPTCSFTRYFSPVSPAIRRTAGKTARSPVPTASGSVMEPLEGDQAVELGRGDPAVLIPHSAEQRPVCLPQHGHAPNLDRALVLNGGPLSESAPSTRGKGEVLCRRRAAGLRTGS